MQSEVEDFLSPMITDSDSSIETVSIAALALGIVFVGSASDACVEAILQALMMRSEIELTQPFARFLSVGLGLLFLGKQDVAEATLEVLYPSDIVPHSCPVQHSQTESGMFTRRVVVLISSAVSKFFCSRLPSKAECWPSASVLLLCNLTDPCKISETYIPRYIQRLQASCCCLSSTSPFGLPWETLSLYRSSRRSMNGSLATAK